MNERIRELAEQCWEARKYGPPWFEYEKFAELIVRECANYAFSDDQERNAMLEYFGVEEPKEFSWVCEKCGADRAKEPCQLAVEGKIVYGNCPIAGVAQ